MDSHLRSTLLIIFAIGAISTSNAGLFDTDHVWIRNSLQHNKSLKIHCKSKDNDLGYHIVPPGGTYEFRFHDNAGLSTLFWCHLWQGPHYKHHQVFIAYKSRKTPRYDYWFDWDAREDGVYEYIDQRPVFKYAWDVPHKNDVPVEILSPH